MKKIFGSSILVALIAGASFVFGLAACSNGSDGNAALLAAGGTTQTGEDQQQQQQAPAPYKDAGSVTIDGKEYKLVTFGTWPQTVKAEDVDLLESERKNVGVFTYVKGSDGEWYSRLKEDAHEEGYNYTDGSEVKQKSANSYKWFKVEPIKWRVLTTDYNGTGRKLLLSVKILEGRPYAESCYNVRTINGNTVYPNNYEYSSIRSFFNGAENSFLQTAFNAVEQEAIAITKVDNGILSTKSDGVSSGENKYICNDTYDKIFLLSERESTKKEYGFDYDGISSITRNLDATDYAKAGGVKCFAMHVGTTDYYGGCWMLRSPCWNVNNSVDTAQIYIRGCQPGGCGGLSANYSKDYGVVPALCLK